MPKIIILITLLFQVFSPALSMIVDLDAQNTKREAIITRGKGYYMDGRGQVPEYARIAPPHEENIPIPHPTKTVVGWDRYYDINKEGYRPMGYQAPLVPNYNIYYSNRRNKPYTRAEYVKVWCAGEADLDKGICTTEKKVYYFYDVFHWSTSIAVTQFRDLKRKKEGRERAYVFYVHEIGLCAEEMYDVKKWAELFDMDVHFVTIDSYIPISWIL